MLCLDVHSSPSYATRCYVSWTRVYRVYCSEHVCTVVNWVGYSSSLPILLVSIWVHFYFILDAKLSVCMQGWKHITLGSTWIVSVELAVTLHSCISSRLSQWYTSTSHGIPLVEPPTCSMRQKTLWGKFHFLRVWKCSTGTEITVILV